MSAKEEIPMHKTGIPDHVPVELIREITLEKLPGGDSNPIEAMCALHSEPEIFFAPNARMNAGAAWIVTRHDAIREVMQNTEVFSSKNGTGFSVLLGEELDLIPLEKDGAEHAKYRSLMNPLFSPKEIDAIGDSVAITAERLVDKIVAAGECEFIGEFAKRFPIIVFLELFGLPTDEAEMDRYLQWEEHIIHGDTYEQRGAAAKQIKQHLENMIEERRARPTDDLISWAVASEIEGEKLSDEEVLGICFLLFVGGLDTVTSSLGLHFKFLAENPDKQQALRDNPELIPQAIEELLRANGVVTSRRELTRDVEFRGVSMKKGDKVIVPLALSGRDEREFECPHQINFEREANRHITFNAGPHRCIGSHLARRELRIAYELWLTKVPPFRIKEGEKPKTHTTGVMGADYLPLVWD